MAVPSSQDRTRSVDMKPTSAIIATVVALCLAVGLFAVSGLLTSRPANAYATTTSNGTGATAALPSTAAAQTPAVTADPGYTLTKTYNYSGKVYAYDAQGTTLTGKTYVGDYTEQLVFEYNGKEAKTVYRHYQFNKDSQCKLDVKLVEGSYVLGGKIDDSGTAPEDFHNSYADFVVEVASGSGSQAHLTCYRLNEAFCNKDGQVSYQEFTAKDALWAFGLKADMLKGGSPF
jgi:hypothetical protein